jgi:hypothetical protein
VAGSGPGAADSPGCAATLALPVAAVKKIPQRGREQGSDAIAIQSCVVGGPQPGHQALAQRRLLGQADLARHAGDEGSLTGLAGRQAGVLKLAIIAEGVRGSCGV